MPQPEFQEGFFKQIDSHRLWCDLLDLVPDIAFFMKDQSGRFIMQNRRACEYCRVATESETLGKRDHDFYPRDRADIYVAGDHRVMRTGLAIINELAPAPEAAGSESLIVYSKLPVRNRSGEIIGVLGLHREIHTQTPNPSTYGRFLPALERMHRHFAEPLRLPHLAKLAGLSCSQFERGFRRLFQTPPRRYLIQVRVRAACRLLEESNRTICDIALETGFFDHSHFVRSFKATMGLSPKTYRLKHFGNTAVSQGQTKASIRIHRAKPQRRVKG